MKHKRQAAAVLACTLALGLGATAGARSMYPIFINGEETELAGNTVSGVTTIGLRALAEGLGFQVEFDPESSAIRITREDEVKITTLAENNNGSNEALEKEFGFSAIIETGNDKIIFDTAKAGQFLKNAQAMKIDLADCNKMVLSHTHYDHCGGVIPYFDTYGAGGKTLFVKKGFFDKADGKYYYDSVGQKFDFTDGTKGYFPVGINFDEQDLLDRGVAIEYLDTGSVKIADGVTVYGSFDKDPSFQLAPNMLEKGEDGTYEVDDFDEEVAVAVETSKGLVILSGCSHSGILNIVNTIQERSGEKVYAVIGGFHLLDADEATIQETIDRFKELGVQQIGLSHCTGPKATAMFQEQMPEQTFLNTTGSVYTVE